MTVDAHTDMCLVLNLCLTYIGTSIVPLTYSAIMRK